jgi:hypothetical protein
VAILFNFLDARNCVIRHNTPKFLSVSRKTSKDFLTVAESEVMHMHILVYVIYTVLTDSLV